MEDLVPPKRDSPQLRARRATILARVVAVVLLVPLLSLAIRRKAIIPDQAEGYRPMTQLTGRERETPRIKLEPPVEKRKPSPEAQSPRPPSPAALPPPRPAEAPAAALRPAPTAPAAPKKRTVPMARRAARPAPPKPKAPPRGPLVLAWQSGPPTELDEAFWPAPLPAKAAPAEPAPLSVALPPAKSAVRGRRAQEPPYVPSLDQPPAPAPDAPCAKKGWWKNAATRLCYATRRECAAVGGACARDGR